MKWLAIPIGAIAGYYCIAIPSCDWLWPESNMCGIWSPFGAIAGAVVAWQIVERLKR